MAEENFFWFEVVEWPLIAGSAAATILSDRRRGCHQKGEPPNGELWDTGKESAAAAFGRGLIPSIGNRNTSGVALI